MHIQCTKKLLDFLKPKITDKNTDDDLYAWHAHYITNNRKKLLVMMNDLSRFTVVFYGIKKADFKHIDVWFENALRVVMYNSGINDDEIDKYFSNISPTYTYNKTKNRTLVSRLNKAVETADSYCHSQGIDPDSILQDHVSLFVSGLLVGFKNQRDYFIPSEKFKEYIDML